MLLLAVVVSFIIYEDFELDQLHVTAPGTLSEYQRTVVIETFEFPRGLAYVTKNEWLPLHEVRLACRVGWFWRSCGQTNLYDYQTEMGAGELDRINDNGFHDLRVFAGQVKDGRVMRIIAGGEFRDLSNQGHFAFIWWGGHPRAYLLAEALDREGNVLYQIRLNSHDNPEWVPVGSGR